MIAKVTIQYFPDIIETIVSSIQKGGQPRFSYGYWLEENNKLIIKSKNWATSKKYPLIFLPVDYIEVIDNQPIYYSSNNFKLYIIGLSKRNYKSEERFESVLKAELYSIYQNLIQAMTNSYSFDKQGSRFLDYEKKDMYYLDAEVNNNTLNKPVEAIRLTFDDLKINFVSECNI